MSEGAAEGGSAIVERRLDLLEMEIALRKQQLEAAAKPPPPPPPKSWWATAIEFLALPAAVLAIVLQLTQASGDIKTQAKTDAETAKAKVDTAKALVETEKLQLELSALKGKGAAVQTQELERLVPRLEESIQKLRALQTQEQYRSLTLTIAKFVVLWILFHAVGLVFDVVQQIWGSMLTGGILLVVNRDHPASADDRRVRRDRAIRRIAQWFFAVLTPVPSVLRWSIQLSIFVALMVPLFDEVARSLGSDVTFRTISNHASRLGIGEALATLKVLLFGGAA